jgi:integrating conjugative element protein (TIGR03757 family)
MSMRSGHNVLLAGVLLARLADAGAAEPSIEVFTLSTLPVTGVQGATVYYLDAVALLEQHLSTNLPADPTQAQVLVTQRMSALGPQLEARARAGAEGLARAAQLGVQRAPAIVFDGKWAVYGVTDVDVARRTFSARVPAARR